MKKYVYALFLCLVCCVFCLSGCGQASVPGEIFEKNAFRILRQVDGEGKITLSYIFPVNSEKLEKLDFDETDVKIYKFYLSNFVSTLAEKYKENANDGTKISRCVYYTDVDGVGFSIEFASLQAQKDFFKVDENEQTDLNTKTSGFFIKKVKINTAFPISSKQSAENIKDVCKLAIQTWTGQNQIEKEKSAAFAAILDESLFIYDTASANNTLKSEVMYEGKGLKHNVFIKSQDQMGDNCEIEYFVTYPNTPIWYLAALLLVPIGMAAAYFYLKNKKLKKN